MENSCIYPIHLYIKERGKFSKNSDFQMKSMNETSNTSQNVYISIVVLSWNLKETNLFNISQFHLHAGLLIGLPISLSGKKSCLLRSPGFWQWEIQLQTFDWESSFTVNWIFDGTDCGVPWEESLYSSANSDSLPCIIAYKWGASCYQILGQPRFQNNIIN